MMYLSLSIFCTSKLRNGCIEFSKEAQNGVCREKIVVQTRYFQNANLLWWKISVVGGIHAIHILDHALSHDTDFTRSQDLIQSSHKTINNKSQQM